MKKIVQLICFLSVLHFAVTPVSAADSQTVEVRLFDRPGELTALIAEALSNNLSLRRKTSETAALAETIPVAGALDDPMVSLGLANLPTDTYSFRQEPMTQKQVAISQKIPWFGKRDLRTRKAALGAEKSRMELAAFRQSLVLDISSLYYEMGFLRQAIYVNTELQQMTTQVLRVAEAGYASGRSQQQDVLQAQVELGKLMEERAVLDRKRETLADRLGEFVSREHRPRIDFPAPSDFPEISIDVGRIEAAAMMHNPALRARRLDIDLADADIDLAKKNYWPDMDFRVSYGFREEDAAGRDLTDFVSGSVTIPISVWKDRKQDRALAAAKLRRKAAVHAVDDLRIRLTRRIASRLAELDGIADNYRLYRDALVAQADLWSRASLAAYQVGKVDFDTMLKSQIRRIRFELQKKRYIVSAYQKLAEIEEIVGLFPTSDGSVPVAARGTGKNATPLADRYRRGENK